MKSTEPKLSSKFWIYKGDLICAMIVVLARQIYLDNNYTCTSLLSHFLLMR